MGESRKVNGERRVANRGGLWVWKWDKAWYHGVACGVGEQLLEQQLQKQPEQSRQATKITSYSKSITINAVGIVGFAAATSNFPPFTISCGEQWLCAWTGASLEASMQRGSILIAAKNIDRRQPDGTMAPMTKKGFMLNGSPLQERVWKSNCLNKGMISNLVLAAEEELIKNGNQRLLTSELGVSCVLNLAQSQQWLSCAQRRRDHDWYT